MFFDHVPSISLSLSLCVCVYAFQSSLLLLRCIDVVRNQSINQSNQSVAVRFVVVTSSVRRRNKFCLIVMITIGWLIETMREWMFFFRCYDCYWIMKYSFKTNRTVFVIINNFCFFLLSRVYFWTQRNNRRWHADGAQGSRDFMVLINYYGNVSLTDSWATFDILNIFQRDSVFVGLIH